MEKLLGVNMKKYFGAIMAGLACGIVNGLFGAGGGMILVPLLTLLTPIEEDQVFSASISIVFPICLVSLGVMAWKGTLYADAALPYLLSGAMGGMIAGKWGHKVPLIWLHRILGVLIAWGGIRYLC